MRLEDLTIMKRAMLLMKTAQVYWYKIGDDYSWKKVLEFDSLTASIAQQERSQSFKQGVPV